MDRMSIGLFVFCSLAVSIVSATSLHLKPSSKEEQIETLLQMTLPLIKQNLINKEEIDSFYKMLANDDSNARTDSKKITNSLVGDGGGFESVKRKIGEDYGHLRFGRNDKSQESSNSRIKYNDPDYGHMRFG